MLDSLWHIEETVIDPATGKGFEGLCTQGSSYFHLRASYEEGLLCAPQDEVYMRLPANVTLEKPRHPRSKAGAYIPGITGQHPLLGEVMVNLPSPIVFRLRVGDEWLDMDESDIQHYHRDLCLKDGVLTRTFSWRTKSGPVIQCQFSRFVSRDQAHVVSQTVELKADRAVTVFVEADIDATVKTNGYDHFTDVQKTSSTNHLFVQVETDTKGCVSMHSLVAGPVDFNPIDQGLGAVIELKESESVVLRRLTGLASSLDRDYDKAALQLKDQIQADLNCFDDLLPANNKAWQELWNDCYVEIEGDPRAQKQLNTALYHLLRVSHPNENRVAVCAKGFAGEAYFGHFFWDSEVYLLPFYLYTMPVAARALTEYRLQSLPGAVKNAQALGYPGAKYAWEASLDGSEQCPNWQYCDHEIHINADVVFGLWHDFCVTKDMQFLTASLPVLVEIAKYWLARVTYHQDQSVSLDGVMGPDEYVCFCKNNAYTNYMVKYTLAVTKEALRLAKSDKKWFSNEEAANLDTVIDRLPLETEDDFIWQCLDFQDLAEPEFDRFWTDRNRAFGTFISQERNYRIKALKQADVLMIPFLFPKEMDLETLKRHYDYYEPYTTHDSSLSYVVHAALCAHMGRVQEAKELFDRAANIDFDGGAAEGVHIANCGGLWQAVIMGFAGLEPAYISDKPVFNPHLPPTWQKLSFPLHFGETNYQVTITQDQVICNKVS